jgi:MFS family permease
VSDPQISAPAAGDDQGAGFRRLWTGQTVSMFGTQVSVIAMPLVAALTLKATPAQMGVLVAIPFVPNLLIGLPAGAWVERVPKRPVLIAGDLGRFCSVGAVPVLALLGVLRIEHLFVLSLVNGLIGVFYDVAQTAYVPALVARDGLMAANGRLQGSRAVSQVAGPSLGGVLVSLLTAPVAVAVDALSFLASALMTISIRRREPAPVRSGAPTTLLADTVEGMRFVFREPILRPALGWVASANLFMSTLMAIYVLYLSRDLRFSPALVGVAMTAMGAGSLAGAAGAGRLARRVGVGGSIMLAAVLAGVGGLLIPAVRGPLAPTAAAQVLAMGVLGLGTTIANVNLVSLIQAVTPQRLMARTIATIRFVTWGVIPLGALSGGALAQRLGMRAALFGAMGGVLLSAAWVLFSRLRTLAEVPRRMEEDDAPAPSPAAFAGVADGEAALA